MHYMHINRTSAVNMRPNDNTTMARSSYLAHGTDGSVTVLTINYSKDHITNRTFTHCTASTLLCY